MGNDQRNAGEGRGEGMIDTFESFRITSHAQFDSKQILEDMAIDEIGATEGGRTNGKDNHES
jgi:hypothetical protein